MKKILFVILSFSLISCSVLPENETVKGPVSGSGLVEFGTGSSAENGVEETYNYVNEKYDFKANLLPGFTKIDYLPDDGGVVMTKTARGEIQVKNQMVPDEYTVEVGILVSPNYNKFSELNDFVMDKYPENSKQFYGDGIYVDEGGTGDAVRHYFMMTKGGDDIVEAYLRVLSVHYPIHQAGFDAFTKTIKLF